MAWDLDTAKQYLDIPASDTTKDVMIQRVLDSVLGTVEPFLQRKLLLAREQVEFLHLNDLILLLPRYPVVEVYSVNDIQTPTWVVDNRAGWIDLCHTPLNLSACGRKVIIDYEGGYGILPPALENALWEAFIVAWASIDPNTGGPSASGGLSVVQGSGEVKSLTVFDAFKVDYDVGTSISGSSSTGSSLAEDQANWGWLAPWASVLSMYRSEQGVGLGMA